MKRGAWLLVLCAAQATWASDSVGIFTAKAPLPQPTVGLSLAPLPDGSALVVANDQAWRFDPQQNRYTPVGPMAAAHPIACAAALPDGRVLVLSTVSNDANVPAAEVFDPATNQFTATGPVQVRRSQAQCVTLARGRVLVLFGVAPEPNGQLTQQAELFDPATNAFTRTGVMRFPRAGATATLLGSGDVLVAGGTDNQTHIYFSAEIYRTSTGLFEATGPMTAYRVYHAASVLPDGSALITGGYGNATSGVVGLSTGIIQATAERYDPSSNSFQTIAAHLTDSRQYHTATALTDGSVLLAGGQDDYAAIVAQAELFDPASQRFTRVLSAMVTPRISQTAMRLSSGAPLLVGGMVYNSNQSAFVQTPAAELFVTDSLFADGFEGSSGEHAQTTAL